jgi:selenocysteine lyase/cysteine desulfurase
MNGFEKTFDREGAPLHVAAHSHHPWPDVSFAAQQNAWLDAAHRLDHKWDLIFSAIIPRAQSHIARQLALPDSTSITFGPNTHGFVLRILSCLPSGRPIRVLTTSSEFMSFSRQLIRLEEDGAAHVTRVACEPFETFEARFAAAAAKETFDLVFFSQVFFDSSYAVRDLARLVHAVRDDKAFVVIDGYHGFMAVPTDLGAIALRAFYLAGGYKYAMATVPGPPIPAGTLVLDRWRQATRSCNTRRTAAALWARHSMSRRSIASSRCRSGWRSRI